MRFRTIGRKRYLHKNKKRTEVQEKLHTLVKKIRFKVNILGSGIAHVINDYPNSPDNLLEIMLFANEEFVPALRGLKRVEEELEKSYELQKIKKLSKTESKSKTKTESKSKSKLKFKNQREIN